MFAFMKKCSSIIPVHTAQGQVSWLNSGFWLVYEYGTRWGCGDVCYLVKLQGSWVRRGFPNTRLDVQNKILGELWESCGLWYANINEELIARECNWKGPKVGLEELNPYFHPLHEAVPKGRLYELLLFSMLMANDQNIYLPTAQFMWCFFHVRKHTSALEIG